MLVLFSLVSLGSSATAILKTNSIIYNFTLGAQFHDGSTKEVSSTGNNMFYSLNRDGDYSYTAEFLKKHKHSEYLYDTSYSRSAAVHASFNNQSSEFSLRQDMAFYPDETVESIAFESFSLNWNFKVIGANASLHADLISGTGASTLTLTNMNSGEITFINDSAPREDLDFFLENGDNYLLSLNMTNSSRSDGSDNLTVLNFDNASFSIPAPNNILILLLAVIALVPLRKSLK